MQTPCEKCEYYSQTSTNKVWVGVCTAMQVDDQHLTEHGNLTAQSPEDIVNSRK